MVCDQRSFIRHSVRQSLSQPVSLFAENPVLAFDVIGVNHHAVRAPVVDLEEPEGKSKWGFVSGYKTGLRHRHDSLPKSKESQIRALEEGRHQQSSSLPL